MKVLLIKDVKSLGRAGEIKEVKEGYGQNFLIAKGFALKATDEVIKEWEEKQKRAKEEEEKEIARLNEIKEKLSSLKVVLKKKLGANGSLYGAVTKDEIAKALKEQHLVEIDKKSIEYGKHALKGTGEHETDVKLGHGIHAKLIVEIVGE
jgi:large subunit ribosomal protein L9